jgi:hypothetical protein
MQNRYTKLKAKPRNDFEALKREQISSKPRNNAKSLVNWHYGSSSEQQRHQEH